MPKYFEDDEKRKKHLIREKTNNRIKSGRIASGIKCNYPGCNETENLVKHHLYYGCKDAEYCFVTYCNKHHHLIHKGAHHEN